MKVQILIVFIFIFGFKNYAKEQIVIESLNDTYNIGKSQANCMYQDSIGFIWFGMANGLYKFDNNSLKHIESNKNQGIDYPDIRTIIEYLPGELLIGTYNYGLLSYSTILEEFDTLSIKSKLDISKIKVNKLFIEKYGVIWIGTNSGLYKVRVKTTDTKTFELIQFYSSYNSELVSNEIIDIKVSSKGEIWFLTTSEIGRINPEVNTLQTRSTFQSNKSFVFFNEDTILISSYGSGLSKFSTNDMAMARDWRFNSEKYTRARYVYKDRNDNLWLSISNIGLFLLDSNIDFKKSQLISNSNDYINSLNSNVIFHIEESRDGSLFICTDAGINIINHKDNQFMNFSSQFATNSESNYGLRALQQYDDEHILIGSMGAGLKLYNINTGVVKTVLIDSKNENFARNIQSILIDKSSNIWIGTEGDGVIKIKSEASILHNASEYEQYRAFPTPKPDKSLLNDFIMCMLEDDKGNMWFGTWYGLSLLEEKQRKKKVKSEAEIINFIYDPGKDSTVSSNIVMCLLQQKNGTIWVGTQNGLNKVVLKNDKYFFENDYKDGNGNSLNAKSILSIYQSQKGDIWFSTTDGGICKLNPDTKKYKVFNSKNGFIDYVVNSMQEDGFGNLWFGTGDGICRFDPVNISYKIYKKEDGLLTNLFLLNSSSIINDKIFFGGDKGLVYFLPENIKESTYNLNLEFTDIKVFNKRVQVNKQGSPLTKNICYTEHIDFKYNQNFLTFEFLSLNFNRQKDVQYSCILEGLETVWNNIGDEHKITYTNLSHGNYTFKVKAYDSGDHTNSEEISLSIKIHPPFWKTTVAYIVYWLFLVFSLFKLNSYFINQEKKKNALALERVDAKKKHEIDIMKLRFFMNVSHEFRTPLTLLSAPLETLMNDDSDAEKRASYYQLMNQNVQRLKRLIDELLELRKIDAGYLKMNWKMGDIIAFSKRIFDTFQTYAEKRNMRFAFESNIEERFIYFDVDKLDKVLFNLISNAFKYTENGGVITLQVNKLNPANLQKQQPESIEIKVKDSGVGISKEAINNIFQRFQNTENKKPIDSASTGIGLSLAKELVEMHGGKIEVISTEEEGTVFSIILPIFENNPQLKDQPNIEESNAPVNIELPNDPKDIAIAQQEKDTGTKPLLQIIEDNEDLRGYLVNELSDQYTIIQCLNGEEGLIAAKAKIPDLILSDIMMDKMDGIELCKKIKSDEKTSHIPVILLTARHADNLKVDGYQIGADDYITKPFSIDILKLRIKNLILQRQKLQAKFSLGIDNVNSQNTDDSLDSKFINKLNKLIKDNIDNSDLNPTYLASELAMSRMQLYRKVTALTDQTVNNYIKSIRLNKAAQLLLTSDLQIAEIAFKVGYSEPSNFTKSFGKHFNQTPSQFLSANKKKLNNNN